MHPLVVQWGDKVRRTLVVCLSVVALASVAARGDAPALSVGAPTTLRLDLVGSVPAHCGFKTAPEERAALGDLATAGQYSTSFSLDCNAMFAIRVASAHAGLSRVGALAATGFATSLDYTIAISVGTDLGTVGGECAASALAGGCALSGGQGLSSGNGIAVGTDGQLTLRWSAPPQRLVSGDYQDSIVITVEART
jgi:hypothetical protein